MMLLKNLFRRKKSLYVVHVEVGSLSRDEVNQTMAETSMIIDSLGLKKALNAEVLILPMRHGVGSSIEKIS
jgi:hypothetical protein